VSKEIQDASTKELDAEHPYIKSMVHASTSECRQSAGGGLANERNGLLQGTPGCENSSVTAMISGSREMLLTIDYTEAMFALGEVFVGKFNTYNELRLETVGLENKVLRQEKTKAAALEEMNTVLEAQDEAFTSIKVSQGYVYHI
jgi:hypothetical protein